MPRGREFAVVRLYLADIKVYIVSYSCFNFCSLLKDLRNSKFDELFLVLKTKFIFACATAIKCHGSAKIPSKIIHMIQNQFSKINLASPCPKQ